MDDDLAKIINTWPELMLDINRQFEIAKIGGGIDSRLNWTLPVKFQRRNSDTIYLSPIYIYIYILFS